MARRTLPKGSKKKVFEQLLNPEGPVDYKGAIEAAGLDISPSTVSIWLKASSTRMRNAIKSSVKNKRSRAKLPKRGPGRPRKAVVKTAKDNPASTFRWELTGKGRGSFTVTDAKGKVTKTLSFEKALQKFVHSHR